MIAILAVIILFGIPNLLISSQSNADKITDMENNSSDSSNVSTANNSQNMTNATKNTISIPLDKPPFINVSVHRPVGGRFDIYQS